MALQTFEKLKIEPDSNATAPKSGLSRLTHLEKPQNGSLFPKDDLSNAPSKDYLQAEALPEEGELADREDNDGVQERDFAGLSSSLGTASELSSLEASLRNRVTSISFDSQLTIEGGQRHPTNSPLPRAESWTAINNEDLRSAYQQGSELHRGHSDTETSQYDSETGEPLDRRRERKHLYYKQGELRHPLLQSTINDLAKDTYLGVHDKMASLTSATTASTAQEEIQTPLNDYLTGPAVASPLEFSPGRSVVWPPTPSSRRSVHTTPMGSSLGSARGRRSSSRRSIASANSPAANYLNSWFGKSAPKAPEEDDEGQEIGDHSQYIIGKQIGQGGFSTVKEAVTIKSGQKITCAVKIVRKQLPGLDETENERIQLALEQELKLWSTLNYKYILPLIEAHTTPFATYCITQLNKGGTLYDLMHSRKKALAVPGLEPYLAKRYIYQLGCAIRYLHEDMRIVHRDIKLENCLLDMSDPRASVDGGNVLLCDFGMADYVRNEFRHSPSPPPMSSIEDGLDGAPHAPNPSSDGGGHNLGPGASSTNVMGTLNYAAPEVVNATTTLFSTAADMWSYGVCMFLLITGTYPFQHGFQPRLVMMITRGEWDQSVLLDSPAVRRDGAMVANLVRGCLEPDPDSRYTIRQALNEDWFVGCKDVYDADEPLGGWDS